MASHRESPLRLRGHHLICLHFFRGEGYNPDFITRLKKLLKRAEAGEEIQICSGPDAVCSSCPYLKNQQCHYETNAETTITEMDTQAIQLLGFKIHEGINWQQIKDKIPAIMPVWASQYCRSCSWKTVCEKDDQFRKFLTRRLKINIEEIQKAMEDVSRDTFDYYFDTETGDVLSFSEDILEEVRGKLLDPDADDLDEDIEYVEFDEEPELPDWMFDEIELAMEIFLDASGRYIRIPERKSSAAFASMEQFIQTLDNISLKELLMNALNGKGAFRKFKDTLIDYPKERKKWHGHNAKIMKREIIEWIQSLGINIAK